MSILGVDVSKYQGSNFPYDKAKAEGRRFVIVQAGYGTSAGITQDQNMVSNVHAARKAGLRVGLYFFAYPTRQPPEAAAEAFWKLIEPHYSKGHDLFPALDFEEPASDWTWAVTFCEYIAKRAGGCIFYSYLADIEEHAKPIALAKFPLWLADYTTTMPAPPTPWHRISIWQKADKDGVTGMSVDLDVAESLSGLVAPRHWHLIVEAGGKVRGNVRVGAGRARKLLRPTWLAGLARKYGKLRIFRRLGK